MVNRLVFFALLSGTGYCATAQTDCFAQVTLDRQSVYVQQPFRVTITVLTASWYTAPLEFDAIQIPSAFILPFEKTTPGMFTVSGKRYAGLQFYFIVFPYQPGAFVIPPIHIIAHTPPAGSSTGKKVAIQTTGQAFTVKPVPASGKEERWFVAKSVTVSQRWNKSLQRLKVGDVLSRTIVIDASGTLPQFIPPLERDSVSFAGCYLRSAEMRDERDDYDANGRLTQTEIYLLEKEGDFELPAIAVSWWNPLTGKMYVRSAAAERIHIAANPDLGMLTTLKDSLEARHPVVVGGAAPAGPPTIFGMAWYWVVLVPLGGAWMLYFLVRWMVAGCTLYRKKHAIYLTSERYAFRRLMRAPLQLGPFFRALYGWWDRVDQPGKSCSLTLQLREDGYESMRETLGTYFGKLYGEGDPAAVARKDFKKKIGTYRRRRTSIANPPSAL